MQVSRKDLEARIERVKGKRRKANGGIQRLFLLNAKLFTFALFLFPFTLNGQTPTETPPPPFDPPTVNVPAVQETTLDNGLRVAVIQKRGLPLVTASLLVKAGARNEEESEAGLANMTGALLIKGTENRSATAISEEIEFLGGRINSGAGWNSSSITINVMKKSLGRALSIMADSALRSNFPDSEIKLLKKQALDGFNVSLKQPGALLSYVSTRYAFGEHLSSGTPKSISKLGRDSVERFHDRYYRPENSVLIFTGDITGAQAFRYAKLFFGGWERGSNRRTILGAARGATDAKTNEAIIKRLVVIDLPDSGQAAVGFAKRIGTGRTACNPRACLPSDIYYPATVLNSVLGGGYSARLNQEIRLKRGLSYGARSRFSWRDNGTNFFATTQTKNESAAQVAELIKLEIEKLASTDISNDEMLPRKAVVTGSFGRGMQTNNGLAGVLRDLYLYQINPDELNSYMSNVNKISDTEIKNFASGNLLGGDMIIVGDSKVFMDDLQKRFPNQTIEVIKANALDLNSKTLRRAVGK